jgi:excisionase family DNA binding protein
MANTDTQLPPLNVTIPEAARLLGCGRHHIYNLMNRGELPWVQLGSTQSMKRVLYADILKYNAARTFPRGA